MKTHEIYECPSCKGRVQETVKRCPHCKERITWSDVALNYEKAWTLMDKANSSAEWRATARMWNKVRAGDRFYFQEKVDWCLEMAKRCKGIEDAFKKHRY